MKTKVVLSNNVDEKSEYSLEYILNTPGIYNPDYNEDIFIIITSSVQLFVYGNRVEKLDLTSWVQTKNVKFRPTNRELTITFGN